MLCLDATSTCGFDAHFGQSVDSVRLQTEFQFSRSSARTGTCIMICEHNKRNYATRYELSESLPGDGRSHSKREGPVPSVNAREATTSENQISDSVGDGNKGELEKENEPRTLPPLATACTTTFIAAVAWHVWIRGSATLGATRFSDGETSDSSSSGIVGKPIRSSTGLSASRSVVSGTVGICTVKHSLPSESVCSSVRSRSSTSSPQISANSTLSSRGASCTRRRRAAIPPSATRSRWPRARKRRRRPSMRCCRVARPSCARRPQPRRACR